MSQPPIIHIGFHKTGTTFLQKNVFENFSDLFHMLPRSAVRDALILPSPLRYTPTAFEQLCAMGSATARLVISNEYISSDIHQNDYHSAYTADRLKMSIPTARVIIGVREQVSMLVSSYNQYIKARGSFSIDEYLRSPVTKSFRFEHLQYHALVEYYVDLYGKDSVLVLPYEILRNDPHLYLRTVFEFIGEPELINRVDFDLREKVNPSLSPLALQIKRYFNPFIIRNFPGLGSTIFFKPLAWVFALIRRIIELLPLRFMDRKIEARIHRAILEEVDGRYEDSNRLLSHLTSFDLKALGYRL